MRSAHPHGATQLLWYKERARCCGACRPRRVRRARRGSARAQFAAAYVRARTTSAGVCAQRSNARPKGEHRDRSAPQRPLFPWWLMNEACTPRQTTQAWRGKIHPRRLSMCVRNVRKTSRQRASRYAGNARRAATHNTP